MNEQTHDQRGELELVRRLRSVLAQLPPGGGTPIGDAAVAFGDDMAALSADDAGLLWTVDMLMDGVDFDSGVHGWAAIGRKAMAVNLSDCAAMAVVPAAALCAVSLCDALTMQDAVDLVHGAHECGLRFGCPIVGGDTNSWSAPTVVSISVAARALPDRPPVRRAGAQPGDRIWLTGPVGGSILGRHMTFEPRVELALQISRELRPHAMIDISDGVAFDLGRVLEASSCGAVVDSAALDAATHADAVRLAQRDGRPPREHALHDGEDFELIVVLSPDASPEACRRLGLLSLGQIIGEPGMMLDEAGRRTTIPLRGWEHFR
jgi:thiamine-monophosphate kinase